MKNSYILPIWFCLITFISYSSNAQKKAPKAVQTSFEQKYPGENDPDWHTDKNGFYESHFKIKGKHYRADFRKNGQWVETERNIKKEDLPKAVKQVLNDKYKNVKIYEIEEVTHHSKGFFYDVELKINGKKKDIEFLKDGTIL